MAFWERAEFPFELVRRMGALGLVSAGIDYPGVPSTTAASAGLVAMELSRGDGSLATFAGVQAGLPMRSIDYFGSEGQKQRGRAGAHPGARPRGPGGVAPCAAVQAGLTMRSIDYFGSEEQKQRWLPALARCEALGAFALTEPDHRPDTPLPGTRPGRRRGRRGRAR